MAVADEDIDETTMITTVTMITKNNQSFVFVVNVVAVVTEASFPNDQQALADETAHLSPNTFGEELKKITVDAPVYASHRKIPYERDIESQIRNLRDRRARVLLEKNYTL